PLHAIGDRKPKHLADRREDVDQRDEFLAHRLVHDDPRPPEGQRHPRQHLWQADALALETVVAGVIAVIGHEDQYGVVEPSAGIEPFDETTDLVVDQPDHAEVAGAVATPGAVVPGTLLLD